VATTSDNALAVSKIDVHHHFVPPAWLDAQRERGLLDADVRQMLEHWSIEKSLADLDRNGVTAAMGSMAPPGIWFGEPAAARRLARECNEFSAELVRKHPSRLGFLAALPILDVPGSLAEIDYALDVLGADGVGILSNTADVWPGDPKLDHIFAELDRRGAVVYVHASVPGCCRALIPGVPPPVTEFLFDTTRAITSFLVNGAFARFRNLRFVFSHAGGTVTVLAHRIAGFQERRPELRDVAPDGVVETLRGLFFDIATMANAPAMAALTALVPVSQILFGTDYPFAPIEATVGQLDRLSLPNGELAAIGRDNSLRLFPRFAAGV
jgi:predicted TIM-barrel fold metal-dependent hydrolase